MQARPRQNLLNQNNNFNTNNVSYNILDNSNLADNQVRRNRPGQVNTNNNVYLPPITENGQSQGPIPNYQRNVQSREREKADFQNPMMVDNYTKNANSDNENVIIAEINNLKKLVKKLYEGQTDTQMRLNDYSKIFSEHDTISRINNLKINEHDTKITEILMSLFPDNKDIEGVTTTNACYGGTNALINAINWINSSFYDGKYAIVIMADVAVYEKGNARATGGCGAIGILLGKNANIIIENVRSTYVNHMYDFYKPNPSRKH